MKKLLGIVLLGLLALPAVAGMDSKKFSTTVYGTGTAATGTVTYVMRGEIESVYVDFTSTRTGTVTIADDYGTIFTKSAITADTMFYPRVAGQTYAGATLTIETLGTGAATSTGMVLTTTSPLYEKRAVAGPVTVTVISENTPVTNAAAVTIMYKE